MASLKDKVKLLRAAKEIQSVLEKYGVHFSPTNDEGVMFVFNVSIGDCICFNGIEDAHDNFSAAIAAYEAELKPEIEKALAEMGSADESGNDRNYFNIWTNETDLPNVSGPVFNAMALETPPMVVEQLKELGISQETIDLAMTPGISSYERAHFPEKKQDARLDVSIHSRADEGKGRVKDIFDQWLELVKDKDIRPPPKSVAEILDDWKASGMQNTEEIRQRLLRQFNGNLDDITIRNITLRDETENPDGSVEVKVDFDFASLRPTS